MRADRHNLADVGSRTLVAVGVAGTSLGGHPLESLVGAVAFTVLQPVLGRGWEWVADVLSHAAAEGGQQVDDLVKALDSSPEQQELLMKALELARATSLKAKRMALAEALVRGAVSAEAAIGETQFVRVLENLDSAHIVVLRMICQGRSQSEMPRPAGTVSPMHYEVNDVAQLVPNSFGRVERLLAQLAAQGLAEREDVEALRPIRNVWCITPYGIEVLRRLTDEE